MNRETLLWLKSQESSVPCNGCTACCKDDLVILGPSDDPGHFAWHFEVVEGQKFAVLDRQEDGSCIYLGDGGCKIHDSRPNICRRFDCRVLVQLTPDLHQGQRIKDNPNMASVYEAGKSRLHTLLVTQK